MKQKIEWYREVLELEPGSRVFFPLAKLLAADGQTVQAVSTLRQGLLRHPDHIEARLLLVELLGLQQHDEDLVSELENLGRVFAAYPGFWRAWSERLADNPALRDAALAMRFFAAALQGHSINWASVIEQGLAAMLGSAERLGPPLSVAPAAAVAVEDPALTAAQAALPEEEAEDEEADFGAGGEEEEAEEEFSLRTRSMAEVLAEQGDVNGALEIYHELMQNAPEAERASLKARAEELALRLQPGHAESGAGDEKSHSPGGESNRLVTLLESLAQRLEARAR